MIPKSIEVFQILALCASSGSLYAPSHIALIVNTIVTTTVVPPPIICRLLLVARKIP